MNPFPREESSSDATPETVVAFVNKNSGERAAAAFVREQLEVCLGEENVFDLFPVAGQPPAIEDAKAYLLRMRPDMIIVAGGDGTVSLSMDIADSLRAAGKIGKYDCPVAVLPMGTGNDLSRSLGFGGGYAKPLANAEKQFAKIINKTKCARQVFVDRFKCEIYLAAAAINSDDDDDIGESTAHRGRHRSSSSTSAPAAPPRVPDTYSDAGSGNRGDDYLVAAEAPDYPTEAPAQQHPIQGEEPDLAGNEVATAHRIPRNTTKVFEKHFMNYFSIGFDADIAADFSNFRNNHPKACSNRVFNKLWYFFFGCKAMCCSSTFPKHRVSLRINDVKQKVSSKSEAIVVSNMLTYAGGAVLWQDPKNKFPKPAVGDGKAEVCILDGVMHMVSVGAHTRSARKMGQGSSIRIRIPADYVMQYDGEPIAAPGGSDQDCVVYITHVGQSLGMELPEGKQVTDNDNGVSGDYAGPPRNIDNPIDAP